MEGFPAPLQDHGITAFHAECDGIGRHIGASFINDANQSQRDGNLCDCKAIGKRPSAQDFSHGVLKVCNLPNAFGHLGQPLMREQQPIQEGILKPALTSIFHISGIGSKDCPFFCHESFSHGKKDLIFYIRTQKAKSNRSLFCSFSLHPDHSLFVHGHASLHDDEIISVDDFIRMDIAQN